MRTQDSGNTLANQGMLWKMIFRTTAMANSPENMKDSQNSFQCQDAN